MEMTTFPTKFTWDKNVYDCLIVFIILFIALFVLVFADVISGVCHGSVIDEERGSVISRQNECVDR